MSRIWLPVIVIGLLSLVVGILSCPARCVCHRRYSSVNCTLQKLQTVPVLPEWTKRLNLAHNSLTQIYGSLWNNIRGVESLDLSHNRIRTVVEGSFVYLKDLKFLDLSHNELNQLSIAMLKGLTNLRTLVANANVIVHLELGLLTNLRILQLKNNRLKRISSVTFSFLNKLEKLNLDGNHIKEIDVKAFEPLKSINTIVLRNNPLKDSLKELNIPSSANLNFLDLSNCGINDIPLDVPKTIDYLVLRRNNIKSLKNIKHLISIRILVMDQNKLENIEKYTFLRLRLLEELRLGKNYIRRIPDSLSPTLKSLYMDENLVRKVTNVFPMGSKLQKLSLNRNRIKYMERNALKNLRNLKHADLSVNNLTTIEENTFRENHNLSTLQLSVNPFRSLPSKSFRGLRNLNRLTMSYISTNIYIGKSLFNYTKRLERLSIDSSPSIARNLMCSRTLRSGLRSLKSLSMLSNDLHTFSANFLVDLPNLAVFKFTSNRLWCDSNVKWFKQWILATTIAIDSFASIICHNPTENFRIPKSLKDVDDVHLMNSTLPRAFNQCSSALPTKNPYTPTERSLNEQPAEEGEELNENYKETEMGKNLFTTPSINSYTEGKVVREGRGMTGRVSLMTVFVSVACVLVLCGVVATVVYCVSSGRRKKWRRKHAKKRKNSKSPSVIKYEHDKDILYFSTLQKTKTFTNSKPDLVQGDRMSLVPGRDINHEGPLRVYKWEDF